MSQTTPTVEEIGGPAVEEQTILLYASGKKIYARGIKGFFNSWRWAFVALTQILYYGAPWITWGERPAVLLSLEERRFYIFDLVLVPQDFIYLTALLLLSAFGLFLFTAVAGRLFCGFACPQTVYTEIFMQVERWIEGDRHQRMRRDRTLSYSQRLPRLSAKWLAWGLIALWTGYTFVGYFIPIRDLGAGLVEGGLGFWPWFWVLFYAFFTYMQAGLMREQVCKYMCPYARFQSAMFDRNTLIVSYDEKRGDPRGKRPKDMLHAQLKANSKGDCIDCGVCVEVCPTGIDIRDGLQYECIGCGLCADACNGIMDKMQYPRGLIRFATLNTIEAGLPEPTFAERILRPRVIIYSSILGVLAAVVLGSLLMREPLKVTVIRDRGALAREINGEFLENAYRLQITNTTEQSQRLLISASGIEGLRVDGQSTLTVEPGANGIAIVSLQMEVEAAEALGAGSHRVQIQIQSLDEPDAQMEEETSFYVPARR